MFNEYFTRYVVAAMVLKQGIQRPPVVAPCACACMYVGERTTRRQKCRHHLRRRALCGRGCAAACFSPAGAYAREEGVGERKGRGKECVAKGERGAGIDQPSAYRGHAQCGLVSKSQQIKRRQRRRGRAPGYHPCSLFQAFPLPLLLLLIVNTHICSSVSASLLLVQK